MNKLNIGMVCYPSYGGSGVVATELGLELANRGNKVHFISYDTPFRLSTFHENISFHEVDMTNYPLFKYPLYSLSLTSKIVEVCESYAIDILHVHYAIPHAICAYLAGQILTQVNRGNGKDVKRVKIVTTLHGTDVTLVGLDKAYYRMVEFGLRSSDMVTSVSNHLREKTIEEFGVGDGGGDEIEVIPNFVDLKKFSPDNKGIKPSFFNDEKVLIHISNFREVKNVEVVIRTFWYVLQEEDKVCLLMVGDGPELSKARLLARELGILEKIKFLGKAERVECLLPYADIILLPSKIESFGLVLLEAMSCGVVTISSNAGGIPELVEEGLSGYMYEESDYEGMGRCCIKLLRDESLLKECKKRARLRAGYFAQDKIISKYEELYKRVLNG